MNRSNLAGIVLGGLTVAVWKQLSGGIFDLYELIPGFILATLAIIVVSRFSGEPEQVVQHKFDEIERTLD